MSQLNCELIRIPIKQINYETNYPINFIKSLSLSELYLKSKEALNSMPITVILDRNKNYQIIKGHEIFHALLKSGKEWVIALCLSEELVQNDNWKYEIGLANSKLNICTLSSEDFEGLFKYLQSSIKKLKFINVDKIVNSFANDQKRIFWSNLDMLVELRAGITKLKISLLEDYIYASPDLSKLQIIRSIDINRSSEEDIFNQIERLKIEPRSAKLINVDSLVTARRIVGNENRIYWSSGNDLIKAKVGISSSIWPLVQVGFSFLPERPPIPNNSKYLLNQLTVKQLREEAKSRSIESKGLLKAGLVEILSK